MAYRSFGLNAFVAFWFAYIVTRPLGASFADWIAVLHRRGGLGLGYGPVSIILTILIAGLVAYLTVSRIDIAPERLEPIAPTETKPSRILSARGPQRWPQRREGWSRRSGSRRSTLGWMSDARPNPDAAFHVYLVDGAYALHLRCCDMHLEVDAEYGAVTEVVARHLSRVHGYIGTVDDGITLEDLRRRLPTKPTP